MSKEEQKCKDACKTFAKDCCGSSSGVYCLGVIGAAVYYVSTAAGFWAGVVGILKAIVWPAFFVFEVFKFLGM